METAEKNAAEYLRLQQAEWTADTNRQTEALTDLQTALGLERPPTRIECFDVSTLQGTNTVGSMVVFRAVCRRKTPTSASKSVARAARANRTTSPVCARCCAAASAASSRRRSRTPVRRGAPTKAGAYCPTW